VGIRGLALDTDDVSWGDDQFLTELAGRFVVGLVGDALPGPGAAAGRFAFRLCGDEIGVAVSDPRIFAMAAAAAGCHPNELVYVGTEPARIAGAQAVGARVIGVGRPGSFAPAEAGTGPEATITDVGELADELTAMARADEDLARLVGLGPHPLPWPIDPRLDLELLGRGDRRNVVDRYRYWSEAAIIEDLRRRSHPFHVAIENWRHDRNIGAVVRNANAFGAAGVHVVGRRRWNRRGAMATDRYLDVRHHDSVEMFAAWAAGEDLPLVGIDNIEGSVPIESTVLPRRCILVFGQEGPGLSEDMRARARQVCAITQFGSTRSVNAGVASGIAMHDWVRDHGERTG